MSDYTPVHNPGREVTFTASAPVVGGRMVTITGPMMVGPAGVDAQVVGTAAYDAATGSRVTVHLESFVHETVSVAAVTAGRDLITTSPGRVTVRPLDHTASSNRVGVAVTSAAAGALVRWISPRQSPTPAPVKSTGATAGVPGAFTPGGSSTPVNLADLAGVTANPATDWTIGQYVVLADASEANWNGTAWVVGRNPA